MAEFSTTSDNVDQTDEDVLTYTVSDEALEAAAGGAAPTYIGTHRDPNHICTICFKYFE